MLAEGEYPAPETTLADEPKPCPRVLDFLAGEGLMAREQDDGAPVPDITREPLAFPASRA